MRKIAERRVQSRSMVDLLDELLNRSAGVFLVAVLAQVDLFGFQGLIKDSALALS
jgi:hypothetical protein